MKNPSAVLVDAEGEVGLENIRRALRFRKLETWFSAREVHRTVPGFINNPALARAVLAWAFENDLLHAMKLKTGGRPTTRFAFKQQNEDTAAVPVLAKAAVEDMEPTCEAHPSNAWFWRIRVHATDPWPPWTCSLCMAPPQGWLAEMQQVGISEEHQRFRSDYEGQRLEHPNAKPRKREFDPRTGAPSFDPEHDTCAMHPAALMLWLNSGHQTRWDCMDCLRDGRDMLDRLTERFGAWMFDRNDPDTPPVKIEPPPQRPQSQS